MWTHYYAPKTVAETLELLAQHADDAVPARLIAGGTDLILELERGARKPGPVIDVSRLGADAIRKEGNVIHLGPQTTHAQVVASGVCVDGALPLAQASRQVGAPQIRNRGTVAGNLVTASPANDTITPLMALNATLTLTSKRGSRAVPIGQFYTGVRKTVLAKDEMLTGISFEALRPNQRGVYIKLGLRRAQAISLVNCAIVLSFGDGNRVDEARITLGAVAPTIIHAKQAEAYLVGKQLTDAVIAEAARLAQQAATPITDVRSSAEYRSDMVEVIVRRGLSDIAQGKERAEWTPDPVSLALKEHTPAPPAAHDDDIHALINGKAFNVRDAGEKTLLRMLREDCGLIGTKEGCAEGECGACTVLLDGKAVMACLVPSERANGAEIVTIEGVAQLAGASELHPLQQSFIDTGAVQCGYCTPGFIMSGATLFSEYPNPTEAQIKDSISGNLCRCTGYYAILEAFRKTRDTTH
ncbi:MAG TPA: FAD binding domain-containing protein [Thermoflexales bacterium]|nr:FAD binding domain-containing protein [Thermoflexales bacterium]